MKKKLHRLKESEYRRILILRTIGNFLILSTLFIIAKTFYLPVKEEIRFVWDSVLQKRYVVGDVGVKKEPEKDPPAGGLARLFQTNEVEILTPEDPQFSVVIPKIGANARILPNIDAGDENVYLPALQQGVAHAAGTAFPGEKGHIFLFAHSTDYFWNIGSYNAVFYLLYKLEKGDSVNVFFNGQRYVYKVLNKIVVNPHEVEYLTRKTNKEFLTLQTCWPPGTTLKRILVFAIRVTE
ncbi:hypothetical protein A3G67_00185 [Candidatus Roizmanbacteria bacterium RIFCSPLOWO2_12_FULL_40_12]|nr:MAG: hypothetical protein A2W49_01540 [Candidatus Roizmanbacteria bacterium RIFCSPHIGHO2_12_41_18]OGK60259.1 MAG: hypothetical protein A3G67_00185 [Candidatus Roizmanbacteria bacterium RIFCSPLOWO2_12_FULL_40_12]